MLEKHFEKNIAREINYSTKRKNIQIVSARQIPVKIGERNFEKKNQRRDPNIFAFWVTQSSLKSHVLYT